MYLKAAQSKQNKREKQDKEKESLKTGSTEASYEACQHYNTCWPHDWRLKLCCFERWVGWGSSLSLISNAKGQGHLNTRTGESHTCCQVLRTGCLVKECVVVVVVLEGRCVKIHFSFSKKHFCDLLPR